ncbi:hypothetical protein FRB90_004804 [Tulasnella sp. 427]|nr:hypothetical protein FRB90_004804 [Tulasnella sp. 427]
MDASDVNARLKPLPNLPPTTQSRSKSSSDFSSPPPLSLPATLHLRRLLSNALEEEHLTFQWLPHLENALQALAAAVRSGGWATGSKEKRLALRAASRFQRSSSQSQASTVPPTPSNTEVQASHFVDSDWILADVGSGKAFDAALLAKLDARIADSIVPAPVATPTHLVVTLAPQESVRQFPELAIDFDLRPHREGCSFAVKRFSLPFYDDDLGERHGSGGQILAGFEEWKAIGVQPAMSEVRIVGGDFALKGVHSRNDFTALTRILQIGVHGILSLQLEAGLFRDLRIPLKHPTPSPPDSQSKNLPTPTAPTALSSPKPNRRTKAQSGLWSFLTKKTEGILKPLHNTASSRSESSETLTPQSTSGQTSSAADDPTAHPVPFPNRVSLDLVRTFSHHIRLSSSDREVQDNNTAIPGQHPSARPVKVFSQVVARLNDDGTILSTSPDVRIPPPAVLLRLAEQEHRVSSSELVKSGSDQVFGPSGRLRLTGEDKVALNSLMGWTQSSLDVPSEEDLLAKLVGISAFKRHQCICVLYMEHVPVTERLPDNGEGGRPKPSRQDGGSTSSSPSVATTATETPSTTSEITLGSVVSGETDTGASTTSEPSPTPKLPTQPPHTIACLPATSKRYQYFSHITDQSLGEFVLDVCQDADTDMMCDRPGCGKPRKDHRISWIHAGAKITAKIETLDERTEDSGAAESDDSIRLWSSCQSCEKRTDESVMSSAAFLSPLLCEHTSNDQSKSHNNLSGHQTRSSIRRHFRCKTFLLTFSLITIESDLFEVRAPRIQIVKSVAEIRKDDDEASTMQRDSSPRLNNPKNTDDRRSPEDALEHSGIHRERDDLRLEITYWWSGLKEHLLNLASNHRQLEEHLTGGTCRLKPKRLPTTPDDDEGLSAKLGERLSPPSVPRSASVQDDPGSTDTKPSLTTTPSTTTIDGLDVSDQLNSLRRAFNQTEQNLYKLLADTPDDYLNDVRQKFRVKAEQAKRRLEKWQTTQGRGGEDGLGQTELFDSQKFEPDWWAPGHHLMPKSRIIVREKDWGSIVAYTLSSPEYDRELQNMVAGRTGPASKGSDSPLLNATPQVNSTPSSLSLTSVATYTSGKDQEPAATDGLEPRPDSDDKELSESEDVTYSALITRKAHPKDAAGILGLRDVLRNQRSVDSSPMTPRASGFSGAGSADGISSSGGMSSTFKSLGNSASKLIRYGQAPANSTDSPMPPSAWARAELELSLQPAKGELKAVSGPQTTAVGSGGDKLIDILAQADEDAKALGIPLPGPSTSGLKAEEIKGAHSTLKSSTSKFVKTPSAVEELEEESSTATATPRLGGGTSLPSETVAASPPKSQSTSDTSGEYFPGVSLHSRESTASTIGPPVPPKEERSVDYNRTLPATPTPLSRVILSAEKDSLTSGSSAGASGSITSTVASAIRYVLGAQGPRTPPKHLGLLSLNPSSGSGTIYPPIDDRPHLKYEFSLGKTAKFSCTVYFARQFDCLRRRCNVTSRKVPGSAFETNIIRSLERCVGWEAEGGKSKSSFLKTEDDRFIIKTLVNAWNVADLQVLLELAPSYFRYMDLTASHASVLAKLMGFYTIEVQTMDPKARMKADLLVMENLFWNLNVAPGRTFDLKGIAGRKVKRPKAAAHHEKKSKEDTSSETEKPQGERRRVKAPASRSAAPMAVQKPLYDSEWIEGQQRAMVLVEPHSKAILTEAIRSDAAFLSKSNIMDYSLLLGLDKERRQIACGLVDTIGSYTFAKTLEYKAKQGLTGGSGREITVVPPNEYQERFVTAMEGYFVACPDKWGKGPEPTDEQRETIELPSVL